MKTLLCVLAALAMAMAVAASAETCVTGDITSSTSWTPAGSPYIIQVDVDIFDCTLTIEGGVTVAFDGNYYLSTDGQGTISATGTSENQILFTSNAVSPAPGNWNWVQVMGAYQSSFAYCTFEYANQGLRVNGTSLDPVVWYCTFRNCSTSGIFCASAGPTVERCDIYACRDGITISGNVSNPGITNNNIYDNTHWNIYVMNYPEPARSINCRYNWWGTAVEAKIAQRIRDSADQPDIYATIDYDPWWTEQPVEATTWGRVKALFMR